MRRAIRLMAGLAITVALSGVLTAYGLIILIRSDAGYCRIVDATLC